MRRAEAWEVVWAHVGGVASLRAFDEAGGVRMSVALALPSELPSLEGARIAPSSAGFVAIGHRRAPDGTIDRTSLVLALVRPDGSVETAPLPPLVGLAGSLVLGAIAGDERSPVVTAFVTDGTHDAAISFDAARLEARVSAAAAPRFAFRAGAHTVTESGDGTDPPSIVWLDDALDVAGVAPLPATGFPTHYLAGAAGTFPRQVIAFAATSGGDSVLFLFLAPSPGVVAGGARPLAVVTGHGVHVWSMNAETFGLSWWDEGPRVLGLPCGSP